MELRNAVAAAQGAKHELQLELEEMRRTLGRVQQEVGTISHRRVDGASDHSLCQQFSNSFLVLSLYHRSGFGRSMALHRLNKVFSYFGTESFKLCRASPRSR